jgi:hypothetical protein
MIAQGIWRDYDHDWKDFKMIPAGLEVSSGQFWMSAGVTLIVAVTCMAFLAWRISPARFREMRTALVITAAVSWGIFSLVLVNVFWEIYYRTIFPAWSRSAWLLLLSSLLYGFFALAFHWLALRLPGHPLVNFCLLAGFEALLEHLWGFYGLKVLEVPLLRQASPLSILAFSFPEYIFYWCVIISLAALVRVAGARYRQSSALQRSKSRWL